MDARVDPRRSPLVPGAAPLRVTGRDSITCAGRPVEPRLATGLISVLGGRTHSVDSKDLPKSTKQQIDRHTQGDLRRAEEIASAHGLAVDVEVGREIEGADAEEGRWCLTLRVPMPDGRMAFFAHYLVQVGHAATASLIDIHLTDLCEGAKRRIERVRRGLDLMEQGDEP